MPLQGAGAFGAGVGSGGFDPVVDPSPTATSTAPSALFFDPNTRDTRMGSDGRFVAVDPVDQEVVLSLWVKFRSIGSAPDTGSRVRELDRQGGPGFLGKIQDIVQLALKRLVDRQAITVTDVSIKIPQKGRTFIFVTYVNNTTKIKQTTNLPVSG